MRNLASSDWFADPELEVITVSPQGGARVSQFTLRVNSAQKKNEPQG